MSATPIYKNGGLITWTPTIQQAGAITTSFMDSFAVIRDGYVLGNCKLTVSSAGTSGFEIFVTAPAMSTLGDVVGSFVYQPVSGNARRGVVGITFGIAGVSAFFFGVDNTASGVLGDTPAVALASGDQVSFNFGYPAAGTD